MPNMMNQYYVFNTRVNKDSDIRASSSGDTICVDLCHGDNIAYIFISFEDMIAVRYLEVALEEVKNKLLKGDKS